LELDTDGPPLRGAPTQNRNINDDAGSEFAYECDLQNYLAKNLHRIEPGLRLYEDEEISPAYSFLLEGDASIFSPSMVKAATS
jgi:hypothetical protein